MAGVIQRLSLACRTTRPAFLVGSRKPYKFQVASLVSVALRGKDYEKPEPYPYKEMKYNMLAALFDGTTWRFDENTKVIIVDGPVGSGKDEFAKEIAKRFDLHYMPTAELDGYENKYGYDLRELNPKLPLKLTSFELHEFLANPYDVRSSIMQIKFFKKRLSQYLDGFQHLLNTGQGVVFNRSIYSDFVFLETYIKHGFLPKTLKAYYDLLWNSVFHRLMRPHAVIYLNNPPENVRKNLQKENNQIELNSPTTRLDVLQTFENIYKTKYLKSISKHADVLLYDVSSPIDFDEVCGDLEELDLGTDNVRLHEYKMKDWLMRDEWDWNYKRIYYSSRKEEIFKELMSVPYYDCDEILFSGEELITYREVMKTLPGNEYEYGFNRQCGDKYLFRT